MIYYKIFPKCSSEALTYNSGDSKNRALLKADANLDTQLWALIEVINGTDHGFALLNKSSDMVLAAPDNYAKLQAISQADIFKGDGRRATWKWTGLGYGALQLQRNTDMNLNVWSDNTGVGVWDWSQGKDNEVWRFERVV